MKRLARLEGENLIYYICAQGHRENMLFLDDDNRKYFINLLRRQRLKSHLVFYAFALLPNLYALLVKTTKGNLSASMHEINCLYAGYFKRINNITEKVFKDRYESIVVEKGSVLVKMSALLHLLPLSMGLAVDEFQYPWSSLRGYMDPGLREDWVDYDTILQETGNDRETRSEQYVRLMKQQLPTTVFDYIKISTDMNVIGSDDYKEKVWKLNSRGGNSDRKRDLCLAKKIIQAVRKNVDGNAVLSRNGAIHYVKKYTGLTNRQISSLFDSVSMSSVGQFDRRFRLAMDENAEIKKIGSRLNEIVSGLVESMDM